MLMGSGRPSKVLLYLAKPATSPVGTLGDTGYDGMDDDDEDDNENDMSSDLMSFFRSVSLFVRLITNEEDRVYTRCTR